VGGLFWLASQCPGKGRDECGRQRFKAEQIGAKLGRALGGYVFVLNQHGEKGTSEGQSEVSKVQKKSESADGGQELHPQLLKELPAATTAISIRKAEA
jgi:hypothetical protein